MSLRRALDRLPHDRESEALIRKTLSLVRSHPDEWIDPVRVAVVLDTTEDRMRSILSVLADSFVLDFDDGAGQYRYQLDRLVEIEIDRFVRRAETSTGKLQNNVEKFRRRYGNQ